MYRMTLVFAVDLTHTSKGSTLWVSGWQTNQKRTI